MIPWASERLDTATSSILATDGEHIRDLHAEAEQCANDDTRKFEQDTLAALKLEAEARTKADAYSHYTEVLVHQKAEAQEAIEAELNSFKHGLKIDMAERKAKAQEMADKAVSSITKYSSKASKGKARHDPIGQCSRTPSISSSQALSPTPTPISSNIPLPRTPEAQIISLMESAPVEVTPKAASFKTPEAASEALAPIMTIIDSNREAKAARTYETISASVAANIQQQLAAFGKAFSDQIATLLPPIANRIATLERDQYDSALHWGRVDNEDFDMEYTAADATAGDNGEDDEDEPAPPFIDGIYRKINQLPLPTAIIHHKLLDEMTDMTSFFLNHFSPSYRVEIDHRTERLPPDIEADFIKDYKAWFESGEEVPSAIARPLALRPPTLSTVKPLGSNALANAGAAGTRRANVKVKGKGIAKLNPPALPRQPSAPPITTVEDPVSSWSMPEDFQEGDSFPPITLSKDHPVFEIENRINLAENEIITEVPAGWITVPRKGKKVSFAAAVKATTPPPSQDKIPPITQIHPNLALDLTKADLDTKTKEEVRRLFNLRFNTNISQRTKMTKDALIASYIAKSNAPPAPPTPPRPQVPKILTTTQYTIVRNPTTAGLHKVTQRSHDQALVVRTLQRSNECYTNTSPQPHAPLSN